MLERGLAGSHISAKCSQSSFPASHVDSMMASRGALCSYEILNLLGPHVWTDHLQASVACGEPGDQMSLSNTHAQTLMHGNGPASVPNKPTGQQMLRQGKKTGVNTQPFPSDIERICSLSEVTRECTGWALKNIKPALKISQEDDGCLSTGIPFRASFIYTSRCRSSASLLLPKGIPACPDVQLFMWSRAMQAAGLKLHIPRMNRRGRIFSQLHSRQIQSLFAKRQAFQITGWRRTQQSVGERQDYTLERSPVHHRTHTIHSHLRDCLNSLIKLT